MNIFITFLSFCVFLTIFLEWRYFRSQQEKCRKYPYFKLRDEIIRKITMSKNYKQYLEQYDIINWTIRELKVINFKFFSGIISKGFDWLIMKLYRNDFKFDEKFRAELEEFKPDPFVIKFMRLMLQTAKQNSIFLRISMSKLGYHFFLAAHFAKAHIRILKKHPDAKEKFLKVCRRTAKPKGKSIISRDTGSKYYICRDYSVINRYVFSMKV